MSRLPWVLAGIVVLLMMLLTGGKPAPRVDTDTSVCAGPALGSVQARNDAMEAGYEINRRYDCIDRASYDAIAAQQQAWEQQRSNAVAQAREQLAAQGASAFAQARYGYQTQIAVHDPKPLPLPEPPASLFVRSDYQNAQNYTLAGFMSPDPKDGRRHPAIIWLTGGDSNTLSDFWTRGPDSNDQSASPLREAGLIVMFPTLRGGNGGRSAKEYFFGEVDDVLSAAEQLARIRYVDPEQIYLGGHSSGGTLALLVAAMDPRFRAVFALGPVASVDRYPRALVPVDFANYDPLELRLRSPIEWLGSIQQPTYVIEGREAPGNSAEQDAICGQSRNPHVHCIAVPGADHYSVISQATRVIAARVREEDLEPEALLRAEDFVRR